MKHMRYITPILALLFIVGYTATVSILYPNTLCMMEANCWIDDYILQLFRWPIVGAFCMALPMCIAMLLVALLLRLCHLPRLMPLSLIVALVPAYFYPPNAEYQWEEDRLFSKSLRQKEQFHHYSRLADSHRWNDLQRAIRQDGTAMSVLGMRYMLLAESANGTLAENLFTYPVSETENFLFRGYRTALTCEFNRQFYDNIGIWDEGFHQAQEYSMSLPKFCLHSLCYMIDYSIKEAEWAVAEKLLTVLSQALFYDDFIADRRNQIAEGRQLKPTNDAPLRQDCFVTGYSLQNEMVYLFQYHIGDSMKIQEYILCCMLIRKNLTQFMHALRQFPRYANTSFDQYPTSFRQAIRIYESREQALRDEPYGTYAHFYYNREIPKHETRYTPPNIN